VRRGELWRYRPVLDRPGQSTLRLIISADAINTVDALPVLLSLHVLDSDPGGLLAVQVPPHGWASAMTIEATIRRRLVEHVDSAAENTMEQVDAALRAAQEL
jgi:mRNA-degrading endonuclease toxin of MazEF toxin-antitoxin module